MPSRRRLELPLGPTLLVLALLVLTLNLGFWQLRREAQKLALQAELDSAALQAPVPLASALAAAVPTAHRVVVQGRWQPAPVFVLGNRSWQGRRGVHLLQWLQLADGRQLLVDRGWQAAADGQAAPEQTVQLRGQLARPETPWRAPVLDLSQPVVALPVLDLALLRQDDPQRLPFVLRLSADSAFALQPNWQPGGGMTPVKHRGYAVTWFALSGALLLLYGSWLWHQRKPA